jgi:hypothetical protein
MFHDRELGALTTEVGDSPAGGAASRGPRAGGCGDLGPLLSRMPLSGTLGNYPLSNQTLRGAEGRQHPALLTLFEMKRPARGKVTWADRV